MTQSGGGIGDYSGSQTGRTVHIGDKGCFRCDLSRDEVTDAS